MPVAFTPPASPMARNVDTSRVLIVTVVYVAFLLDNILLTVVVPIIPDFLYKMDSYENATFFLNDTKTPSSLSLVKLKIEALERENGPVGALLSSKALVQLAANPIVGFLTSILGYNVPMIIGTTNLLIASLLFAYGENYPTLLLARSLHGTASALISVSGMCVLAEFKTGARSRLMGLALGGVAAGVLLGYPLGGVVYDLCGKAAAFLVVSVLVCGCLALQISSLDTTLPSTPSAPSTSNWRNLLTDIPITLAAGAICVSTTAMSVLEPCLPLWLMGSMDPPPRKWQLGTVFIPDSLGYLLGTNCTGMVAEGVKRWKVALGAMVMVGVCATLVPSAVTVVQLIGPHFGLGLGIGILDASLVPLLANLVDYRHGSQYGAVYALQQVAVSLAYSLGPLLGGELVKVIGFPWLMRIIGFVNILYCPLLLILAKSEDCDKIPLVANSNNYVTYNTEGDPARTKTNYKRFTDEDE